MEQYKYNVLETGDLHQAIRLLSLLPGKRDDALRCTITTVFLEADPNYEALSYCWGPDQATERIICNDDSYIALNQSLSSALRRFRHDTEPRTLWADAICINQADFDEKSVQVNMMREVYRQARKVLIWLGEDEGGHCLKPLLKIVPTLTESNNKTPSDDRIVKQKSAGYGDKHVLALSSMLRRPWFRRIWIVQEVAMAREATIYCGNESLDWEKFHSVLKLDTGINMVGVNNQIVMDIVEGIVFERRAISQGISTSLLQVLLRHRTSLATDPRDKIYALLGLCSDNLVQADYKIGVTDLNKMLVQAHLRRYRNLDIITVPSSPFDHGQIPNPSWVPDWSALDPASPLALRGQLTDDVEYKAAGQSRWKPEFSADDSMLGIQAQFLGNIMTLGDIRHPYRPTEEGLKSFFEQLRAECRVSQTWYKIGLGNDTSWKAPYRTGETLFDVCWQILLAGCPESKFNQYQKQARGIWKMFRKYLWASRMHLMPLVVFRLMDSVAKRTGKSVFIHRILNAALQNEFELKIRRSISYRRMMRTNNDYLGLVPSLARVGDHVVLVQGMTTPAIVRHHDNGYEFIGDCYVHGIMKGEAFNPEECKPIWLV